MERYRFKLGNIKPGTTIWIRHLGKVKFLRINENKHAVINLNGSEMTMMPDTKVKLKR